MNFSQQLSLRLAEARGSEFSIASQEPVGGGCISSAYRLQSEQGEYLFLKTHRAAEVEMFAAEAEALQEIANSQSITVPRPVSWGVIGEQAYLVMDYLELGGRGSERELGGQLAAMHRHTRSRYGWHRHNTIGATFQDNTPADDWLEFWRERRLGVQLGLAQEKGYGGRLQEKGRRVQQGLEALFEDYTPEASLLHGDLWSGNYSYDREGRPVIFDPAVYYGDRETDIAMTELFGGFGAGFYAAYNEAWPLHPGYARRKTLYNLYHILNHLNLFGSGYAGQAEGLMDRLLSEI